MQRPGPEITHLLHLTSEDFTNALDLLSTEQVLYTDPVTRRAVSDRLIEAMIEGCRNYNPLEGVKPDSEWITLSEQKTCIVLSDPSLDIEIEEDE